MRSSFRLPFTRLLSFLCFAIVPLSSICCTRASTAQSTPVDLRARVDIPFRFVAYGDARFHDPHDTPPADPAIRVALVQAVANADPAFICFTGDLVYNGYDSNDWKVWDTETSTWRDKKIPVYPALGNHDLHGGDAKALPNYFQRFPDLKDSRYYSVRAANILLLVLDSSQDEVSGAQGQWLTTKLDNIPPEVDFVFLMLHHPLYTSAHDLALMGAGHAARGSEQHLAKLLEERQARTRARFIVFSGHVHNYERHEHGGVVYFVSGGGGAAPFMIDRQPTDLFQSKEVNYHYLLVEVDHKQAKITMNRVELINGKANWTQPDSRTIPVVAAMPTH